MLFCDKFANTFETLAHLICICHFHSNPFRKSRQSVYIISINSELVSTGSMAVNRMEISETKATMMEWFATISNPNISDLLFHMENQCHRCHTCSLYVLSSALSSLASPELSVPKQPENLFMLQCDSKRRMPIIFIGCMNRIIRRFLSLVVAIYYEGI